MKATWFPVQRQMKTCNMGAHTVEYYSIIKNSKLDAPAQSNLKMTVLRETVQEPKNAYCMGTFTQNYTECKEIHNDREQISGARYRLSDTLQRGVS